MVSIWTSLKFCHLVNRLKGSHPTAPLEWKLKYMYVPNSGNRGLLYALPINSGYQRISG